MLIHACMCTFYTRLITVGSLYSVGSFFCPDSRTTNYIRLLGFFCKDMCSIYSCAILIFISVVLRTNSCKMERHPALIVGMQQE